MTPFSKRMDIIKQMYNHKIGAGGVSPALPFYFTDYFDLGQSYDETTQTIKNVIALVQHNPIGKYDTKEMSDGRNLYEFEPTMKEKLDKIHYDMMHDKALLTLGENEIEYFANES